MSVLLDIEKKVRLRLRDRQAKMPRATLEKQISPITPVDFSSVFPKSQINIIAEVKRASPSEGKIAENASPLKIAQSYIENKAAALSILTEEDFFNGSIQYLREIRAAYPHFFLLMKDFIVDEYQILEAVEAGASSILLILSLLDGNRANALLSFAKRWGLHSLVEVHDEPEMKRALDMGASFIGINHRNLKTMSIDITLGEKVLPLAPKGTIVIGESGLNSGAKLKHLHNLGFDGFLIGTHFMKTPHPGLELAKILKEASD